MMKNMKEATMRNVSYSPVGAVWSANQNNFNQDSSEMYVTNFTQSNTMRLSRTILQLGLSSASCALNYV